MSLIDRRRRELAARRAAILDTARSIAAAEGWQAVSMRKIAAAIEYSPTIIYEHFASREELILEIVKDGYGQLTAVIERLGRPADLHQLATAYFEFSQANRLIYEAMFGLGIPYTYDLHLPAIEKLYGYLSRCIAQVYGAQDEDELMALAILFWSHLHGLIAFSFANTAMIENISVLELIGRAVADFEVAHGLRKNHAD